MQRGGAASAGNPLWGAAREAQVARKRLGGLLIRSMAQMKKSR